MIRGIVPMRHKDRYFFSISGAIDSIFIIQNIILTIAMARTEEKYECRLCFPSLTFDRKFLVKRHIMEQHSGFAYTCTGCQMEVVRRSDGMQGSRAQEELEKYTSRIEDFIRVVSPRGFRELSLHPSGRISRTPSR